jgi:TonB family protein
MTPIGITSIRSPDDFYPAASIRNSETGVVVVEVCVSEQGVLTGTPRVSASSGHSRLDAAAVSWAQQAARFTPARRNGEPIAGCKGVRVNFQLRGR